MKLEINEENKYDSIRFFDISTGKDKAGTLACRTYIEGLEKDEIYYTTYLEEHSSIVTVVAKDVRNPKRNL